MPENDETPTQGAPAGNQERTFTQAELDAVVRDRLKREREKYADYAELQRKASAYDEAQEAAKSDLQKAVERAEKAEQALAAVKAEQERAALVAKLAAEQEAAKPKYPSVKDKGEVASIKTDAQNDFVRSLFKGDR